MSEANGVPTKVGCQAAGSRHFTLHPHLSILHKVLHCIQDFLRTGNSQYLELQITERNGIKGIVLKGDDDRAVVVRRADLEPDTFFGKEDELGGAPTLHQLREIEEHFDDLLYLRIHNIFSVLCPVVPCPTEWDSGDSWDKFDIFCGFVPSRGTVVGCQPGQVRDHPSKGQQHLGIQVKCREQSEESPDFPEVSHSGTMPGKEWDNRQEGQGNRPGSEQVRMVPIKF